VRKELTETRRDLKNRIEDNKGNRSGSNGSRNVKSRTLRD